ncbi:alpha-ketoacid dehydrogenase subunit alpha/beta [Acrocarpospora catenulata]|uniref:alpha-ketoacid dehydrogenase subunit alpha/beta n=1 Tax=Acrocarpospora catenulata TaxID=2836182 RepID=UPI001BDA2AD6|nr:alpha-ketoacid dehydrogenase subunit alpha/beta [Acrocarpospora catenulata]
MVRIRLFEDHAARLYRDGLIPGFVHLSTGQEAVAVGVCHALEPGDVITSTHRGHGHAIAKGADVAAMFAELMGRATGTCGGMGGSMHIADPRLGVFGANGIVGAGVPIAGGAALAMKLRGQRRVAVAFFGDGAVATGAFHEAANLAACLSLPLLLVCEDNGYSEFSPTGAQHPVPLAERARAYGLPVEVVDGNDVEAVHTIAARMAGEVRAGAGPALLVARTLRLRGHYEGDPQRYRSAEADAAFADPLDLARRALADGGVPVADVERWEREEHASVEEALAAAARAPWPDPDQVVSPLAGVYPQPEKEPPAPGAATRVSRLLRKAMGDALADDPAVFLAGIDVGAGGNVFGLTRELAARFPGRVIDTPISESAIVGAAVGAAMDGLSPVVEIMYLDFVGVCLDQLLNQAAKLRFMTGGAARVGLTVRTQYGVGRSSAAQHSQSLEALLAHIPGLVVVMPSAPEDHYGLLRSAIESPDPVVVIENRLLYEKPAAEPPPGYRVPLGRARIAREGEDVTVVSVSHGVWTALEVAERAREHGISVEVVDLRTVSPWDRETVLGSLAKTSRIIVYSEAVREFGISAEILAEAADAGFWSLDAPPRRLAGRFSPVPYSPPLEREWLPSADALLAEIRHICRDK